MLEAKEIEKEKQGGKERPIFHYTVDGEAQETSQHVLTPIAIMKDAGVEPSTHYLVQMIGHDKKSYQDNPNEEIHMHNHMVFFTNAIGPTPVS